MTRSTLAHRAAVWALCLSLFAGLSTAHAAAPKADYAQKYTVGVFTYFTVNGKPRFAKALSGVIGENGTILTSSWALEQGLVDPFSKTTAKEPSQILAVIRKGDALIIARCIRSPKGEGSPLAVLEIDEAQRDAVKQIVAEEAKRTKLDVGSDAMVVGVVGPNGIKPKQLSPQSVPAPLAMAVKLGQIRSFHDGQYDGASILAPIPPQMIGGGVWDNGGNLMGILVRSTGDAWHVMDTKDISRILNPPPKVEVAAKEPEKPASAMTATAEKPAPSMSKEPEKKPEPASPTGKSFAEIFKELGVEKKWDDKMLDHTGVYAVDAAQAYLAGGKPDDALKQLAEAEKNPGDQKERIDYLKTIATIMQGKFEAAQPLAEKANSLKDPLLAARGHTVYWVLRKAPSGNFEGKKLTEPDQFQAAYLGWLEKIKGQVEEGYEAAKAMPMTNGAEFKRRDAKLEQALNRTDTYKLAWAGFWDEISATISKDRAESAAKAPK